MTVYRTFSAPKFFGERLYTLASAVLHHHGAVSYLSLQNLDVGVSTAEKITWALKVAQSEGSSQRVRTEPIDHKDESVDAVQSKAPDNGPCHVRSPQRHLAICRSGAPTEKRFTLHPHAG